MPADYRERAFETAIEEHLLANGCPQVMNRNSKQETSQCRRVRTARQCEVFSPLPAPRSPFPDWSYP